MPHAYLVPVFTCWSIPPGCFRSCFSSISTALFLILAFILSGPESCLLASWFVGLLQSVFLRHTLDPTCGHFKTFLALDLLCGISAKALKAFKAYHEWPHLPCTPLYVLCAGHPSPLHAFSLTGDFSYIFVSSCHIFSPSLPIGTWSFKTQLKCHSCHERFCFSPQPLVQEVELRLTCATYHCLFLYPASESTLLCDAFGTFFSGLLGPRLTSVSFKIISMTMHTVGT